LKQKLATSWNNLRQQVSKIQARQQYEISKAKDSLIFAREILRNPRAIGAALPSSPRLAKAMAAEVPLDAPGLVVELGAGTGIVTEALLRRGLPPDKLVVVELSPGLAAHLRRRFPHLRIIEGDAAHLHTLLGADFHNISTVVSSLPLRSLPGNVVYRIVRQFERGLRNGGTLVQFTYDPRGAHRMIEHFRQVSSRTVWQNVPPAKVLVFRHQGRAPG
jgi:phospholipid N-methyltransferase